MLFKYGLRLAGSCQSRHQVLGQSGLKKKQYTSASIVGAGRVVFNIKGNDFRLVTGIGYRRSIVFIKWLGSHKDYDAIDVRTAHYDDQTDQDGS